MFAKLAAKRRTQAVQRPRLGGRRARLRVGGVLIHPIGVLLARVLGRSGQHTHGNPLGHLALETTVWLVMSMPIAYVVSLVRLDLFFPAMLLVIGGRYTTFATIFGRRVFWACGGALVVAAYVLATLAATPATGAFTGAALEALFAVVIAVTIRRDRAARPPNGTGAKDGLL